MKPLTNPLFVFCLLACAPLFGQAPEVIATAQTAQHRQAPGTSVWLVPPKGFRTDAAVPTGFYKDEFNFFSVEEVPSSKYDYLFKNRREIAAALTDLPYQSEREWVINGLNACVLHFSDLTAPRRDFDLLLTGNEQFVVLVRFFSRAPTTPETVAACLRSLFIPADAYPEAGGKRVFELDLKTFGYVEQPQPEDMLFAFAPEGSTDPDSLSAALLIIQLPKEIFQGPSDLAAFHHESLASLAGEYPPVAEPMAQQIVFQHLPAVETTYESRQEGQVVRVYQMSIEHPNYYFIVLGAVHRNLSAEMTRLKALIQTLRFP